jgi:ribosomal protein S18 acetylase RimI-like enzyme
VYTIREYTPADRVGVLDAVIELQDYERILEDDRLPGADIAEKHLEYMLQQCADKNGRIFVASISGRVAGLVCVWAEEAFGEHYARPSRAGFISDLVVREGYRRGGIGRALLEVAEDFLRAQGVTLVHLGVLSRNAIAQSFYVAVGYREYEVVLIKNLVQDR